MTTHDTSEADIDRAVARAFGHAHAPRPRSVSETVREQLQQGADAAASATPWRDVCPWRNRDALAAAEGHLADLYSSRRGQTAEAARQTVETTLREAWFNPGGFGTAHDRMVAVGRELDESTRRLEAMSPIAGHATGRPPAHTRESGRPTVVAVSEADVDNAVARAFGRSGGAR